MLLAVGLVSVGWAVLRARLLPTWLAVLLIVSAIVVLAANEQTSRILLAVPFGPAWTLVGTVLLAERRVRTAPVG